MKRPKAATIKASKHNVEVELPLKDFMIFLDSIWEAGGEKIIDGVTWKLTAE